MNLSFHQLLQLLIITVALQGCAFDGLDFAPPCTAPLAPGYHTCGIFHNGENRHYSIYIPTTYTDNTAMPLVVDIHGAGSPNINGEQLQILMSDMITQAKEHQFILSWPQAINGTWNLGSCCGGKADVNYLQFIIEEIKNNLNIDETRVYGTGLSTGAAILQRTVCKDSTIFTAIAPVSFSLVGGSTWCDMSIGRINTT